MNVGLIVLCRYSSSRLPGKILRDIHGKKLLQRIFDQLQRVKNADQLVVATSDEDSDDPIADFCATAGIPCFRGSLEDVSLRFLQCAAHFKMDYCIRINGDNLFIDPNVIQSMIDITRNNNYDFVTNVPGRTFPFGMSVEILRTSFYKDIYTKIDDPAVREHVTLYLYQNEEHGTRYIFENIAHPEGKGLQLAIDELKDAVFAEKILVALEEKQLEINLGNVLNVIHE